MKIYTKTGDKGTTSLYDGTKVCKDNIIIECIGSIDELNSDIGLCISFLEKTRFIGLNIYLLLLKDIQSQLFDLGALIAYPSDPSKKQLDFDIEQENTKKIEKAIDDMTRDLPKLVNFILPGGSIEMSIVHRVRTTCRRTERKLVLLKNNSINVQDNCLVFINRLSDFFFTLARYVGKLQEIDEVIYKKNR